MQSSAYFLWANEYRKSKEEDIRLGGKVLGQLWRSLDLFERELWKRKTEQLNSMAYCMLCKMHICVNVQYMCKIVLISPMCNICTRFAQDCTYFSNAQYMCKIVLLSPMGNICTRFVQDCTNFSNVQYMRKIFARLYLFLHCARLYLTSNLKC